MVKIIEQNYKILTNLDGLIILKNIERAARTCYKSEPLITEDGESAKKLCKKLVELKHTAMLEHGGLISVKIICNRGLTHELVRHRTAVSYAQESTRYCDYSKTKHGNKITVIRPLYFGDVDEIDEFWYASKETKAYKLWFRAMEVAEDSYFRLRENGVPPQVARGVLPIDVKTEIIISTNPTEWRHILKLRTSPTAHPQIRAIMIGILQDFKEKIPIIFDDILPEKTIKIDKSVLEGD